MAWKHCMLTVVLGAGLLAVPAGATQMYLDPVGEGFENFTDGALSGQGTWGTSGSNGVFVASYAQEGYTPQGVKYIYLNKGTAAYSTLPTPYTNSTLESTFFINAAIGVIQKDMPYIRLRSGATGTPRGPDMRLGDGGGSSQYLYYDGGGGYTALDLNGDGALDANDNLAAAHWYEFRVTINLDTEDSTKNDTWTLQTRDLGAPGSLDFTGSFLTAKNSVSGSTILSTRSDVDDIKDLQLYRSGTTGSGSFQFDTVLPEPATMLLLAAGGLGVFLRRKR